MIFWRNLVLLAAFAVLGYIPCWAIPIRATIYCATAGPSGFTIMDLRTGKESHLTSDPAEYPAIGSNGYSAIENDNTIRVFRGTAQIGSLKRDDPKLVGWLGENLVFKSKEKVFT